MSQDILRHASWLSVSAQTMRAAVHVRLLGDGAERVGPAGSGPRTILIVLRRILSKITNELILDGEKTGTSAVDMAARAGMEHD